MVQNCYSVVGGQQRYVDHFAVFQFVICEACDSKRNIDFNVVYDIVYFRNLLVQLANFLVY